MPKILMVHTGGTLMMRAGENGAALEPDSYARDLRDQVPVLRSIATIDPHILLNLDSGDIQPHHWVDIARVIHERIDDYDGAVVITGTDAMAYTASALSFLLPGLDRPVVLTGAQRPLFEVRTDARSNLINACHIATMPVPEVGVSFMHRFLRGCRTTKLDAWGLDAFASPNCPPLVELGLGVKIASHVLPMRPAGAFDARIDPDVLCVRVFPGLNPDCIEHALQTQIHGVVLEGYGLGNVPKLERSLLGVIERAVARQIPVVIVSQCPRGAVDLSRYPGSSAAEQAGALSAGDMTTEAALTKLMVLLGRASESSRVDAIARGFSRSLLGEMSDPS